MKTENDVYEFIKEVELDGNVYYWTSKNGLIVTKSTSMNEKEGRRRYDLIIAGETTQKTILLKTTNPKK